jgi:hypothetical protein
MTAWYNEDLAYIHDVGFHDYALKSAPGILEILTARQIPPVPQWFRSGSV